MDFHRGPANRFRRIVSRLESRLPGFLRNPGVAGLETAIRNTPDKLAFLAFVDSFQDRVFDGIRRAQPDETFAKLFSLKLSNLAVARYHHHHRHAVLASGPIQLTVDPTNVCQLGCPGCVHSANEHYAELFAWPREHLPLEAYRRFLDATAPFAFATVLYNYGEPLLNRNFVSFVRASKPYLLFAMTSTNLSLPLADVDGLVSSGLDRMVLSIDGTTPEVYERYRRNGNLELVLENVRKLVDAKTRLKLRRPYLVWQFLTFEHNRHQVQDAMRIAREIGVNEIMVETPFDVTFDDPGVRAVSVPERGSHIFEAWRPNPELDEGYPPMDTIADGIDAQFDRSWTTRLGEDEQSDPGRRGRPTCDWLYQNITMDGAARIMPCCMAPLESGRNLAFGRFDHAAGSADRTAMVNSEMAVLSRLAFADRQAYDARMTSEGAPQAPFCAVCTENPVPYGLLNVAGDIRELDRNKAIPASLRHALTTWG